MSPDSQADLASLEAALARAPNNPEALQALADAYADHQRWPEAVALYRTAIALAPTRPELYNSLAIACEELQEFDEAEKLYQQALTRAPNFALVYYNLGVLYEDQQRIPAALQAYTRCLEHSADVAERTAAKERLRALRRAHPAQAKDLAGLEAKTVHRLAFFKLGRRQQQSLRAFLALTGLLNALILLIGWRPTNVLSGFVVLVGLSVSVTILYYVRDLTRAPNWLFQGIPILFWLDVLNGASVLVGTLLSSRWLWVSGLSGVVSLSLALAFAGPVLRYRKVILDLQALI